MKQQRKLVLILVSFESIIPIKTMYTILDKNKLMRIYVNGSQKLRSVLYIPGEHTVDFIAFSKLTNGWTTRRPGHEYSDGQSDILHSTQDDILSTSLKKKTYVSYNGLFVLVISFKFPHYFDLIITQVHLKHNMWYDCK